MDTQFFSHGTNNVDNCPDQRSAINFIGIADVITVGPLANAGGAQS